MQEIDRDACHIPPPPHEFQIGFQTRDHLGSF